MMHAMTFPQRSKKIDSMAPKAAPVKSGSSRSFDPVKEDDTPREHIVKEGIPYYLESVKPNFRQ